MFSLIHYFNHCRTNDCSAWGPRVCERARARARKGNKPQSTWGPGVVMLVGRLATIPGTERGGLGKEGSKGVG